MKKIITLLISSMLILSIFALPVFAKDTQNNGKPFQELWDAVNNILAEIASIWEAIENIELIPGPEGPPGDCSPTCTDLQTQIDALEARISALETGCIPEPEVCDGIDNDCDGEVDEDYPLLATTCDGPDSDMCENGVWMCKEDSTGVICSQEYPYDIQEICNGVDDDCDGEIDEGCTCTSGNIGEQRSCSNINQYGTCYGIETCDVDGWSICTAEMPEAELCDGVDNDCDGMVDEDFPLLGMTCDGPDSDMCENGVWECKADMSGVICSPEDPSDIQEICNEVDDDCDGVVDDPFIEGGYLPYTTGPLYEPDYGKFKGDDCGTGVCAGGVVVCNYDGSGLMCDTEWYVEPDVCDGVDNDCDGEVDEGCDQECVINADCDDGDLCTVGDICIAGVCYPGVQKNCNDGNPCTSDSCNFGDCMNEVVAGIACDDGNLCTIEDTCDVSGQCIGIILDCNDGNACTIDSCDGLGGCQNVIATPAILCRQANGPCDIAEVCDGTSPYCPADAKQSPITTCRASLGECDPAELCDGTSDNCPSNVYAIYGLPCGVGGTCDGMGSCLLI